MPNVGRPSRDCHLCRQRRVKCDLGQPECNRCIRLGRSCPGYRNEFDLVFRVESPSSFAESASRDRRRKRPSPLGETCSRHRSPESVKSEEQSGEASNKAAQSPTRSLDEEAVIFAGWYLWPTQQLAECWDAHALVLAFSNLSGRQRHTAPFGLLCLLPQMIAKAEDDSAIIFTCRAIGNAFLTRKVGTAEARSKRVASYGQALTATNAALKDPALQKQDETLASVWLLSLYELIASPTGGTQPLGFSPEYHGLDSWVVHTQGMASLLRLRGTSHLSTRAARCLFWLVYITIQVRCFITGIEAPSESSSWFRAVEQHLTDDEWPAYRLCVYGHRASTLCAQIQQFIKHGTSRTSSAAADLLAEAERFEKEMRQSWESDAEGFEAEVARGGNLNLRVLCSRTFFYAFRLRFQLSLLELLNEMQVETRGPDSMALENQLQLRVQAAQGAADEILACVPLLFPANTSRGTTGGLKSRFWTEGVRVLWPLRLVALCSVTRDDQKWQAQLTLQQIREDLGIKPGTGPLVPSILAC